MEAEHATLADRRLEWDRGDFCVSVVGAMCGPANFTLDDGRVVQPFAVAPWSDNPDGDPRYDLLPPLLRRLRGEWACIPFGAPQTRDDLPTEWTPEGEPGFNDGYFHGPSSNLPHEVASEEYGAISFVLDYPDEHPIARVRRSIRGVPGRAMLEFGLEVEARRTVSLPIGIHPTLRLPDTPGRATLQIAGKGQVHTFPTDAEPGISRLAHGVVADDLSGVPNLDGGKMDLTSLPLPVATEELVLVAPVSGRATLTNNVERYRIDLRWDPAAFPLVNLWLSNRGRSAYPWNGRHLALGIEPVSAPWDLGAAVASSPTSPLRARGLNTSTTFTAGQTWSTRYSVEIHST